MTGNSWRGFAYEEGMKEGQLQTAPTLRSCKVFLLGGSLFRAVVQHLSPRLQLHQLPGRPARFQRVEPHTKVCHLVHLRRERVISFKCSGDAEALGVRTTLVAFPTTLLKTVLLCNSDQLQTCDSPTFASKSVGLEVSATVAGQHRNSRPWCD